MRAKKAVNGMRREWKRREWEKEVRGDWEKSERGQERDVRASNFG